MPDRSRSNVPSLDNIPSADESHAPSGTPSGRASGGGVPDLKPKLAARLLKLLQPRHVLLAGAGDPALATYLADQATATKATLHIATNQPPEWLPALRRAHGDSVVVHQTEPPAAIGVLPVPGLAWVDADPNHYTTTAILNALEAQAQHLGQPFPVTIVANTGWPHGRRDAYANPAAIPPAHRHPHERAGLIPGQSAPTGGSGLNDGLFHASTENEPGNGVLTAVEDFLTTRAESLRLVVLPGFGGLAAITPRIGPGAAAFTPQAVAEDALAIAAALEEERLAREVALAETQAALRRAEALAAKLQTSVRDSAVVASLPPPPSVRTALSQAKGVLLPAFRRAAAHRVLIAKLALRGRLAAHRAAERAVHAEAEIASRLRASPIFDGYWYLTQYPDVTASGLDPAVHYLRCGDAELRDPGPFFSTAYYLSHYQDVAAAGHNPLLHYLASGGVEGRNPSPRFAGGVYLEENKDVAEAGLNPLEHYLSHGRAEGRRAPQV